MAFGDKVNMFQSILSSMSSTYKFFIGTGNGEGRGRTLAQFWGDLGVLFGSTTWDVGSLVDGAGETKSITVTGAALGDYVVVGVPVDAVDMTVTGYVQAADTVEIRVQNESGSTADLASATWNVMVVGNPS